MTVIEELEEYRRDLDLIRRKELHFGRYGTDVTALDAEYLLREIQAHEKTLARLRRRDAPF